MPHFCYFIVAEAQSLEKVQTAQFLDLVLQHVSAQVQLLQIFEHWYLIDFCCFSIDEPESHQFLGILNIWKFLNRRSWKRRGRWIKIAASRSRTSRTQESYFVLFVVQRVLVCVIIIMHTVIAAMTWLREWFCLSVWLKLDLVLVQYKWWPVRWHVYSLLHAFFDLFCCLTCRQRASCSLVRTKDGQLLRWSSLGDHHLLLAVQVWSAALHSALGFYLSKLNLMARSTCTHELCFKFFYTDNLVHTANTDLNSVTSSYRLLLMHVKVSIGILHVAHMRTFLLKTQVFRSICMSSSTVLALEASHCETVWLHLCHLRVSRTFLALRTH